MLDRLQVFLKLVGLSLSLGLKQLTHNCAARVHRLTYKLVDNPKNVVVIGGSMAGFFLAKELAESLPTGYRVILIEKKSHYHFTWNFPRISVVDGHDNKCFIPFPRQISTAPAGVYEFRQATVVAIDPHKVTLDDGSTIEYEYLAIATGSKARYPAQLDANEKRECIDYFQAQRGQIEAAKDIVIVGGGAAGVEIAGDIKTKFPDKNVTLVHSRDRLLNNFDPALHEIAKKALEGMGVVVYLADRVVSDLDPELTKSVKQVMLRDGKVLQCDHLIKCTGQSAQSDLTKEFSPASVAPTGGIRIEKTLQMKDAPSDKIFALGDVIDTPGPKMGRAASLQGFHVARNIVRSINHKPLKPYKPSMIDTSIDLTLGLGKNVMYISDLGRRHLAINTKTPEELHAARAWQVMDMKPYDDPEYEASKKLAV
ncbi:Fe-regulated protein 8 [Exophiala dermatitidis]